MSDCSTCGLPRCPCDIAREAEVERLRAELADEKAAHVQTAAALQDEERDCEQAEARLAKVVDRHQPIPNQAGDEVCVVCGVYWPCGERRHYDSLGIAAAAQPEEKP